MGLEACYDFIFPKTMKEPVCRRFEDYLMVEASRDHGVTASGRAFRFIHPWHEHPKAPCGDYLIIPIARLREAPENYSLYEHGDFEKASPPFQLDGGARPEFFAMAVRHEVAVGESYATIRVQSQSKNIAGMMVATDSLQWIDYLRKQTGAEFVTCQCDYGEWLIAPDLSLRVAGIEYRLAPSWSAELDVDLFAAGVAKKLATLRELVAR